MFSTFTTKHGALCIRTEDLRKIEDTQEPNGDVVCVVEWVQSDGSTDDRIVEGTARENLERLQREELEMIERSQRAQQRQAQGLPVLPVPRGKR